MDNKNRPTGFDTAQPKFTPVTSPTPMPEIGIAAAGKVAAGPVDSGGGKGADRANVGKGWDR